MYLFAFLLALFAFPALSPAPAATPLYLSTDDGNSWQPLMDGLPEGVLPQQVMEHDGTLFLTTESDGLFALPREAEQWTPRGAGLPSDLPIFAIAGQGSVMVLGTYGQGVFISRDGGAHWRRPVFNIRSGSVLDLLFHKGVLLAATDSGLWRSYDLGEAWYQDCGERTLLSQLAVYDGDLYVARQNGVGRVTAQETVWADLHTEVAISQLYTAGDQLYATTVAGTVVRTRDGRRWTPNDAPVFPPAELPAGRLTSTSRGWIASLSPGC